MKASRGLENPSIAQTLNGIKNLWNFLEKFTEYIQPLKVNIDAIRTSLQDLDFFVASADLPDCDRFLEAIKVFVKTQADLAEYFSEMILPALESVSESHQANSTIYTTLQESKLNYQAMVEKTSNISEEMPPSSDPLDDPTIYSGRNLIESGFELSLRMQSNILLSTASILHSELEFLGESQNFVKQRQDSFLYYVGSFIEPVNILEQKQKLNRQPVQAQKLSKMVTENKMEFSKNSRHSPLRNSLHVMIASFKEHNFQQYSVSGGNSLAASSSLGTELWNRTEEAKTVKVLSPRDLTLKPDTPRHTKHFNECQAIETGQSPQHGQTQLQPLSPSTKPKISKAMMETDMLMSHPRSRRSESVSNHASVQTHDIPLAIRRCVEYITARGLKEEGIFRESGSKVEINAIYSMFQRGKDFDFSRTLDTHVVAGVLKVYLRDMIPPLFPYELYREFIGSEEIEDESQRIKHYKTVLAKCPKKNIATIKYLFRMLKTISDHHQINKMNSTNLGIVFGPTLLRPNYNAISISTTPTVVSEIINFFEQIF